MFFIIYQNLKYFLRISQWIIDHMISLNMELDASWEIPIEFHHITIVLPMIHILITIGTENLNPNVAIETCAIEVKESDAAIIIHTIIVIAMDHCLKDSYALPISSKKKRKRKKFPLKIQLPPSRLNKRRRNPKNKFKLQSLTLLHHLGFRWFNSLNLNIFNMSQGNSLFNITDLHHR